MNTIVAETGGKTVRKVLYEACRLQRQWPENIQPQDTAFFSINKTFELPVSYVLRLEKASLLADGVVFRAGHIYDETFVGPAFRVHNWRGLVYIYLTLPKVALPPGVRYLLVHDDWANNYYHWIADSLPRLFTVREQLPELTLLLPDNYTAPFIEETLRVFGVKHIQRLKSNVRYAVDDLLVPLRVAPLTNYRPEVMRELSAFLLKQFQPLPHTGLGKRIYISRSRATRRKVINEQQVIKMLAAKGFAIVCFEDYTFQEQVSIAAQAQYLVSIHGAGLTNMLFMPPNGCVLELQMRDDGSNCFYYTMADSLNIKYYYQFCETIDANLSVQDADLLVNVSELSNVIDLMINE
ncbi:glycosyltransferase family 61 protein [Hymenobacter terrestris]|uniref:Glycosyltransferase family 61 protein n=1 Tax=Hymenobacter terrestris TaxID=2748310 RepID=A0ABX2Q4N1_9BACT|nr:glycosyltransferase family 61 protein [Hymenobacter terrestris]NVO85926.1 glycosyltransferase family 61 protein [Hymenobacter terrestris]